MSRPALKVSVSQFEVRGGQSLAAFLQAADAQIAEAVGAGSELLVFPELFVLDMIQAGSVQDEAKQLHAMACDTSATLAAHFAKAATTHKLHILAGSWPRLSNSGQVRNCSTLFYADGKVIWQEKLQLTPDEKKWGWERGQELKIFDAPWGRSCILICLDSEIPAHSHALAAHRPEVILLPSMTSDVHGFHRVRWSAQCRAVEHLAFVVHSGTVGARKTESEYYGQAALLNPAQAGFDASVPEGKANQAQVVHGSLDLSRLRATRKIDCVYPAQEQIEHPLQKAVLIR